MDEGDQFQLKYLPARTVRLDFLAVGVALNQDGIRF